MVSALRRLVCCGSHQLQNRLEGPGQDRGGSASSRAKLTEDGPSAFFSRTPPVVDNEANHTQAQDGIEVEVISGGAEPALPQPRLQGHAMPYTSQQSLSAPTSPCRGMGPRPRPGAPISAASAAGPMAQLEEEMRSSETSPFRNPDGWSTTLERSDDGATEYPPAGLSPTAGTYSVQAVRPLMVPGTDVHLSSSLSEPAHSSPDTDSQQPTGASTFAALNALGPPPGFRHRSTASIRLPSTSSAATFATAPSALPSGASVLASGISALAAAASPSPTPTPSQPLPSPPPSCPLATTANVIRISPSLSSVPLPPLPPSPQRTVTFTAAFPAAASPTSGAGAATVPFRPPPAPPTTGLAATDMVADPAAPFPAALPERKQHQRRSAPGASRLALSARYKPNAAFGGGGNSNAANRGNALNASRPGDAAGTFARLRQSRSTRLPTTSDAGSSYGATGNGVPATPTPRVSGLGMLSGFTRRLLQMVQEGVGSMATFNRTPPASVSAVSAAPVGAATTGSAPSAPQVTAIVAPPEMQIHTSVAPLAFVMSPPPPSTTTTTDQPSNAESPQSNASTGVILRTIESDVFLRPLPASPGDSVGLSQGGRAVMGRHDGFSRLGGGGLTPAGVPTAAITLNGDPSFPAAEDLRDKLWAKSGSTDVHAQRSTAAAEQLRDDDRDGKGAEGGIGGGGGDAFCRPPPPSQSGSPRVFRPRPRRVVGAGPTGPGPAGSRDSWVEHLEAASAVTAAVAAAEDAGGEGVEVSLQLYGPSRQSSRLPWIAQQQQLQHNAQGQEAGEQLQQQQMGTSGVVMAGAGAQTRSRQQRGVHGGVHEVQQRHHLPAHSQPLPLLHLAPSSSQQQQCHQETQYRLQQQQMQQQHQQQYLARSLQPWGRLQSQQGTSTTITTATTTATTTNTASSQHQQQQQQQLLLQQLQKHVEQQQRAMSQPLPRPSSALQNWAAQQQLYQQQVQQGPAGLAPQPLPSQSIMAQSRALSHLRGGGPQQPQQTIQPQHNNYHHQHTVGEFCVKRDLGGPRVFSQERTRSEAEWSDAAAVGVPAAAPAAGGGGGDIMPCMAPRVTSCNCGVHGLGAHHAVQQPRAPVVPTTSAPATATAGGGRGHQTSRHVDPTIQVQGQSQVLHTGVIGAGNSGLLACPGPADAAAASGGGNGSVGGMAAGAAAYGGGSITGLAPPHNAAAAAATLSIPQVPVAAGSLRPSVPSRGGDGDAVAPFPFSMGLWAPVVGSRPAAAAAGAAGGVSSVGAGAGTGATAGAGGGGEPGAGVAGGRSMEQDGAAGAGGGRWLFDAAQQQQQQLQLVPTGSVSAGRMSRVVNPDVSQVALMQLLHFGSLSGRVPLAQLATLNVARLSREIRALHWIGQGGGGAVFQGVWQGAPVAVKFMLAAQPEHVDATALEAIVSLAVGHPNVVTTYSFDVTRLTEGSFSEPEWGGPGGHLTMGALHNTDDSSATALYNVLMDTNASLEPSGGGVYGEGGGVAPSTSRTRRALQSTTSGSGMRFRAGGGGGGVTAGGSGGAGGTASGAGGGGGSHAGGAVSRSGAGRVERLESLNMRVRRAQAAAVAACPPVPEGLGATDHPTEGAAGAPVPPAPGVVGGGEGGGSGSSHQHPEPHQHQHHPEHAADTRGGAAGAVYEAPFSMESLFNSEEGFGEPDLASNSQSWTVRHVLSYLKARPGMYMTHIIMEYCDRGSLQSAIKRGVFRMDSAVPDSATPPPITAPHGGPAGDSGAGGHAGGEAALNPFPRRVVLRALLRTARDVAQGMSHLHANGIIHGDLKPGNVLLRGCRTDRRGFTALVSDFGLSKLTRGDKPLELNHWSTVTVMAPEVIMGRWLKASDVFSFGILLWQLVAGDMMPYGNCTVRQVLIGVAKGTLKPEWPAHVHPALVRLGRACLATSPEQRPSFPAIVKILTKIEQHVRNELRPQRTPRVAAHPEVAGTPGLAADDVGGPDEGADDDRGSFGEEGGGQASGGSGSLQQHRQQQHHHTRQSNAATCHRNRFRSSYR